MTGYIVIGAFLAFVAIAAWAKMENDEINREHQRRLQADEWLRNIRKGGNA